MKLDRELINEVITVLKNKLPFPNKLFFQNDNYAVNVLRLSAMFNQNILQLQRGICLNLKNDFSLQKLTF